MLSYWAWHCIHHLYVIQIYVGQKDNANQWKVTVLEESVHTVLLYQAVTVRIINVLAILNNTLSLLKKNNEVTFLCTWLVMMHT